MRRNTKKAARRNAHVRRRNTRLVKMELFHESSSLPENPTPSPKSSQISTATPTPGQEIRATAVTGAQKGRKPERYSLIPVESLEWIARAYDIGAKKYSDHNWRGGYPWSWSYDALQRHANAFWKGQDNDDGPGGTGLPHLALVAWHSLSLLWYMEHRVENDDRWKEKIKARTYKDWVTFD